MKRFAPSLLLASVALALVLHGVAASPLAANADADLEHGAHSRQLLTVKFGWGHYMSTVLNTVVEEFTKATIAGQAAAVRQFLGGARGGAGQTATGAAAAAGTAAGNQLAAALPLLLNALQNSQAQLPAAPPSVQLVKLPSSTDSNGIRVRTRTPVKLDSPVHVKGSKFEASASHSSGHSDDYN